MLSCILNMDSSEERPREKGGRKEGKSILVAFYEWYHVFKPRACIGKPNELTNMSRMADDVASTLSFGK